MALSLSPAAKSNLKDFLVCFSLGNLCFLRRWYDLEYLKERSMDYYRVQPADPTLLWATLIAATMLAVAFWLVWLWVQRWPSERKLKFARATFVLLLIFPLESVRRYWNSDGNHADWLTNGSVLLIEGILAFGLVMTLRGNLRVLHAARRVTLALTLLFPALMLDFAVAHFNEEPASRYDAKPSLPMLPHPPGQARHRVIWMLFDEFDQRLAFELHKPKVDFSNLERLRSESMVADYARQTAPWTTLALPSILSGQIFSRAELIDADTLRVYHEGSNQGTNWRDQPNVFKKARAMGKNAEIVGWHHPYCRVFGDMTVRCTEVPSGHPTGALLRETSVADEGVPHAVKFLLGLQLGNVLDMLHWGYEESSENGRDGYVQRRQQKQYFRIRDLAYAQAADPQIDFLFIHFPLPHLFAIYNREGQNFDLNDSLNYADNLALVDRTVGEMRKAIEQAGLWDSTSILITSDHGLRPDLWRGRMGWTPELEQLTGGRQSESVPFIVKLAGENRGATYERAFSSVVASDLVLAMLSGDVTTPQSAAAWLDGKNLGSTSTQLLK
jgi:hypothetical protein